MADEPRWLSDDEQATWRAYLLSTQLLDEALERQLQHDAGMGGSHYMIFVALSEAPGRTLRMSELARRLRYSQSRMTHAITSLERNGWVRREQCPTDKRGWLAVLTDEGMRKLEATAPGHVDEVRARLFDQLSPAQVDQLHDICDALLAGLDPSPARRVGAGTATHGNAD